jgi:DUF1009 family protein
MAKLGIIAGGGALPGLIAEGSRKLGKDFFVIAFTGYTDPAWAEQYPHKWFRLGQIGGIIREMKKQKAETVVFAGHIERPTLKHAWTQLRPDWHGLMMMFRLLRRPLGDDALLRTITEYIEKRGLNVVGADQLVPDSLMPRGILTMKNPTADEGKDIDYATNILRAWAELDQGQSIVVQHGIILGVEAAEGTDELIRRCGQYKRKGTGPVLVKIKKPQQDRRLDLPTIGENTIKNAIAAGFSGIAVQANEALFLQPLACVREADKNGLFIAGFEPQ